MICECLEPLAPDLGNTRGGKWQNEFLSVQRFICLWQTDFSRFPPKRSPLKKGGIFVFSFTAQTDGDDEKQRMQAAFLTSCRMEIRFFEMAYALENW